MSKTKSVKKKEETEIDILKNIERKMDKLTGIIAIQGKEKDEQIKILTALGFTSTEIAPLIGTTAGNVQKRNFVTKKKSSKSIKKKEVK